MILTDEEIQDIRNKAKLNDNRQIDHMSFARDIERAVLAKAGEQEPIYMWRLEDDGWMECTKEFFDADISSGYEKRIVYDHPLPAQAIPEWQPIETVPFNTPVLVSDEKIIASMFFYKRKDKGYEHFTYPEFMGAGDAEVRVSLHENGCYSKLRWWRPMLDIPLSASQKP